MNPVANEAKHDQFRPLGFWDEEILLPRRTPLPVAGNPTPERAVTAETLRVRSDEVWTSKGAPLGPASLLVLSSYPAAFEDCSCLPSPRGGVGRGSGLSFSKGKRGFWAASGPDPAM